MSTAALQNVASSRARRSSQWWWDRTVLTIGMLVVTILAWRQLAHMQSHVHAAASFALSFALWSVMLVAMMLPAASPMIMTFAAISGRNGRSAVPRTAIFVAAYLGVWAVASAGGALAQSGMNAVAARAGVHASPLLLAGALFVAGIWQLTPLKHACLRKCRTPLGFLMTEWRDGARGAVAMGARHGADCVLCCWALMAVMLGLGTMNLAVMAILTVVMIAEKVAPGGHRIGRAAALALLASGGWQLVRMA